MFQKLTGQIENYQKKLDDITNRSEEEQKQLIEHELETLLLMQEKRNSGSEL